MNDLNSLSEAVIGAAIEVHRSLGPGLLESTYESCLSIELDLRSIPYRRQVSLPISYKGTLVENAYRIDLLVSEQLIVEVKSVAQIDPVHEAQLLTYLNLANKSLGLLLNFNVRLLRDGICRRRL